MTDGRTGGFESDYLGQWCAVDPRDKRQVAPATHCFLSAEDREISPRGPSRIIPSMIVFSNSFPHVANYYNFLRGVVDVCAAAVGTATHTFRFFGGVQVLFRDPP